MFIKLTRIDGQDVWFNSQYVVTVEPRKGSGALVVPLGDGIDYEVRESPEMIVAALGGDLAPGKAKRPPPGEIKIITQIADPNYTYTPDFTPKGRKPARHIFPPGPNNPVGTVWLGLSIPGYGIHGTPLPERIGRAESHGCFRLANWNAEKLYELVKPGTRVLSDP